MTAVAVAKITDTSIVTYCAAILLHMAICAAVFVPVFAVQAILVMAILAIQALRDMTVLAVQTLAVLAVKITPICAIEIMTVASMSDSIFANGANFTVGTSVYGIFIWGIFLLKRICFRLFDHCSIRIAHNHFAITVDININCPVLQ